MRGFLASPSEEGGLWELAEFWLNRAFKSAITALRAVISSCCATIRALSRATSSVSITSKLKQIAYLNSYDLKFSKAMLCITLGCANSLLLLLPSFFTKLSIICFFSL